MTMQDTIANAIWSELQCQAKDFAFGKMTINQAKLICDKAAARAVEELAGREDHIPVREQRIAALGWTQQVGGNESVEGKDDEKIS